MLQPGTPEWFNARLGRFTAYNIHDLLSNGKAKDSFGKGFYNLCFDKAVEKVFGYDESWDALKYNWDVKRGNELEPEAFEFFQSMMARKFINVEKSSFFPYKSDGGATPDGLVGKTATLQIKCPRPEKVFKLINLGIEAVDPEYISQMQKEMLATNSDHAYFFNYCIFKGEVIHHTIIVEKNIETQKKIKERIIKGAEERDRIADELIKNKQF